MVINCYYEFPGNEWNLPHYFQSFFDKLKGHYPEYTFNSIDTRTLDERTNSPCCKYSHHHMIIENDSTKKYFLVSYWDKMNCIHEGTGWDMRIVLKKSPLLVLTLRIPIIFRWMKKFTPFSYLTPRSDSDDMIQKLCGMDNNERIIPDKPMFKGSCMVLECHCIMMIDMMFKKQVTVIIFIIQIISNILTTTPLI